MRFRLVLVSLAVSSMVAVAFSVPLALLVRDVAHDRATTAAERDASSLGPVLAVSTDVDVVQPAMDRTVSGSKGRLGVIFGDGTGIGLQPEHASAVARAVDAARSARVEVPGGIDVVQPFVLAGGRTATVIARVPNSELERGVRGAWLLLGLVGAALVAGSVVVADRLAGAIVRPTRRLAEAAASLAAGDLDTRVDPDGPDEIVEVAGAFNHLAGRIGQLLAKERELVVDLSHRLRTPLTALRLDADALGTGDAADRVRADASRLEAAVTAVIEDVRRADHRTGEPVDASAVVVERAAFWAPLAEEQGRPWTVDAAGRALVAIGVDELGAAIDAVLGNVFAHTPEGAGVRIAVDRDGPDVVIAVEDDGPGLPPGAVERGASGSGSTGLGLDIVRRTAEEAGGDLELASSPSGGARVAMRVPAVSRPG